MPAHIDFESRSTVDLKKEGLDRYSRHADTALWCMAYAFGDDPVQLWTPNDPDPDDLLEFVQRGGVVKAHNATFEFIMWNRICRAWGWPTLNAEQMRCTMAMAYAMGLPGSLEKACAAVGLEFQKDMKGHRRMLQMARPRDIKPDGTIVWWDDDQRKAELYEYCKTDVEAERALDHRLRELPADEEAVRQLDTRINLRGVRVDLEAAKAIHKAVEREKERLDAQMERATGGMVKQCTWVNVLTDWLRFEGVDTPGVAKADVKALLESDDTPEHVKAALRIRQRAAKTSTAKIDKMFNVVSPDERVRWLFQYHGAATGRWAGRAIQLQNLPRGFLKPHEVEAALDLFNDGDIDAIEMLYGDPMDVASSCIRGLFIPADGHVFQAADFSNIEGRKMAWLAGEEWKLEAFRKADAGEGPEIYKITAGGIIGKEPEAVTDWERQVFGKTSELALQFAGGVGAYDSMGRVYGIDVGDHYGVVRGTVPEGVLEKALEAWSARGRRSGARKATWVAAEAIKVAWRDRHPATVAFWYALEDAAISAVSNPGKVFSAGPKRIVFKVNGSFLWCRLPSGRLLCYPYPKIEDVETPWGSTKRALTYMSVDLTYKWTRTNTHGGKLAENVVQASAADNLRFAMHNAEADGRPIVLHVHDEIVTEVPEGGDKTLEGLERLMEKLPPWAEGLPLQAKGWEAKRFRKD